MSHGGPSGSESSGIAISAPRPNPESISIDSVTVSGPNHTSTSNGEPERSDSIRTNTSSEDGRIHILKQLEESIETFRSRKVSKTEAISTILQILRENVDVALTQSQKDLTLESYLTEILSIQSSFDETEATRAANDHSPGEAPNLFPLGTKRGPRKSHQTDESDDEEEDSKSSKRPRLLESDMPWYTSTNDAPSPHSNPSCEETCRLL